MHGEFLKLVKQTLSEKFVTSGKIKPFATQNYIYVELFVNPSKSELGTNTRGIILPTGDLYILSTPEQLGVEDAVIHIDIIRFIKSNKISDIYFSGDFNDRLKDFFAVLYDKQTNTWGRSESYTDLEVHQEIQATELITKAKEKNPSYNFTTEYK